MIYHAQATSKLSVEAWCEALEVSPSGYYAWRERDSSPRQQADARLGDEIERVFADSRHTYGSHRVWLKLRDDGIRTSRKRVERLMRERGLRSIRARKRRVGLTKAGQSVYFAPNLLKQNFHTTTQKREVGHGYHLHPDARGLAVSGQCDGLIQPPSGRLGDG